jgi:Ricin-type beta-trefoil lectin domain
MLFSQNLNPKVFLVETSSISSVVNSSITKNTILETSSSSFISLSNSSLISTSSTLSPSSTSSISSSSSVNSTEDENIPDSIKIDPNLEMKIKNCVSKDSKIEDVAISVYQDTINDPDGSTQIGIALAKRNPKSKKKNHAQTYTFKVNKGKVKCKSVASEIIQVREPTQQDITETQKKFKDFTEKMKIRKEKESKDEIKIPDNYVPRKLMPEKDEEPLSILDLFGSPKVNAGLYSGNNPSNIYQHEDLLINTSKELGVSNKNQVAYIAATGFHETGEFVFFTEDCKCGDPYTYFENKYGRYSDVGPGLGNTSTGDGAKYLGRGYVHLTGKSNYQTFKNLTNIDIINNPNTAATNKDLAAFITVDGMTNGRFTGVGLGLYINSNQNDFFNARRTVNVLDVAAKIEDYTRRLYLTDSRIINYSLTNTPPKPPTFNNFNGSINFGGWQMDVQNAGNVAGDGTYRGTPVQIRYSPNVTNQAQKWFYDQQGKEIKGMNDYCLDAGDSQGRLVIWTCNGSNNQKWTFYSSGLIKNQQSNQCISIPNGQPNSVLGFSPCGSTGFQAWSRSNITLPNKVLFRRENTNQCMASYSPYSQKQITTQDCNSNDESQQWEWIYSGVGFVARKFGTNFCMDVYNPGSGNAIQVYNCNWTDSQKWWYNNNKLLSRAGALSNNQCVAKWMPNNGQGINSWNCDSTDQNQRWDTWNV